MPMRDAGDAVYASRKRGAGDGPAAGWGAPAAKRARLAGGSDPARPRCRDYRIECRSGMICMIGVIVDIKDGHH